MMNNISLLEGDRILIKDGVAANSAASHDKYNGIYSYNLKGEVIGFASAGRINNLDIRTLNDTNYFFGTNTGSNTIDLWIYKNSVLTDAAKAKKFALSDIKKASA